MENEKNEAPVTDSIVATPDLPDVFMKRCPCCGVVQSFPNDHTKKALEYFRDALIENRKCNRCKTRMIARNKVRRQLEKHGRKTSRRFRTKQRDK